MLGIIVQLIISWLLLKFIEHKNLLVLGIIPTKQRLKHFGIGILMGLVFLSAYFLIVSLIVNNPYKLNSNYTTGDFFNATFYVLRSVAFEELIFRGALLYILIQRLGATKAIIISAIGFGIYHWFSYGILGQPVMMAFIFLITGIMGYLFALAFQKTRSLYLPFALHFGYNFTSMVIFSNDKGIGPQLLVKTVDTNNQFSSYSLWLTILLINALGFPLVTWLYLRRIKAQNKDEGLITGS